MKRRYAFGLAALAAATFIAVSPGDALASTFCDGLVTSSGVSVSGHTYTGTSGDDVIVATNSSDTIYGEGGDDTICALDGDDWVEGGQGSDTIWGGGGADSLFGETFQNTNLIFGGDDRIHGGSGDDLIEGDIGQDTLWGDEDNDTVLGGEGSDTIRGGINMLESSDPQNDVCYGEGGSALIPANDTIYTGNECETWYQY